MCSTRRYYDVDVIKRFVSKLGIISNNEARNVMSVVHEAGTTRKLGNNR